MADKRFDFNFGANRRPEPQLELISGLAGIHRTIADNVCAKADYRLTCKVCQAVTPIGAEKFAEYLKHGWPKHCGQTMALSNEAKR